jgi:hypothetical protein
MSTSVVTGHYGKAAFATDGPLLLFGWAAGSRLAAARQGEFALRTGLPSTAPIRLATPATRLAGIAGGLPGGGVSRTDSPSITTDR